MSEQEKIQTADDRPQMANPIPEDDGMAEGHGISIPEACRELGDEAEFVHPADLADHLENLSLEKQVCALRHMPTEDAAEALAELEGSVAVDVLENLDADVAAQIIAEMEQAGEEVQRDPFGHVKLDTINPGAWFARQFADRIGAEKVMVQKSGYFSRSARANETDLELIRTMVHMAVASALEGISGVVGHDEENGDVLTAIAFDRIKGGKPFEIDQDWYKAMLAEIGQEFPARAVAH